MSNVFEILRIRMKPIMNYLKSSIKQATYLSKRDFHFSLYKLYKHNELNFSQLHDVNKVLAKETDQKCKHFKRERCKTSTKLGLCLFKVGHVTIRARQPDFDTMITSFVITVLSSVKYISSFLIINS